MIVLAVVTPICIIIIIDSVRNNANWQAISYLLFYSQVWWILIQTVARTYMLIAAYSRRDPLPPQQLGSSLPLESSMPFDKIFCEAVDGGCQVVTYNVSGCGMASGAGAAWATSFVEIVLLCVFMLLDIFKRKVIGSQHVPPNSQCVRPMPTIIHARRFGRRLQCCVSFSLCSSQCT